MNGLSTKAGTDWQGIFQLAMGAIITMPEGTAKTALLVICLVCMATTSFATKGSGISPEQGKEVIDATRELKSVLGEGRDELQ
jgi:hypothetical protein